MKYLFAFFLSALILTSCDDKPNQRIVPASSGKINNLLIVVDNLLWESEVGETVRDLFAQSVHGMPQDEPLYTLSQMPPMVFSDFATRNRIILKIEKGKETGVSILDDKFARPQTLAVVAGTSNAEIIKQLETNFEKIETAFRKEEIKEKQRRIGLSLHDVKPIETKLGVTLRFPTAYRIAVQEDDFFWIRKDIRTGNVDLMLYEVPLSAITKGDSTVVDIIRMRDSVGEKHIQSSVEGTYMRTEPAYAPYMYETIIDNKPTIETKGIWDMKNGFMAGPFINYAIEDKVNNRYVVVEGYVFAPSIEKRDYVFELEAIIKSIKIK